MSDKPHFKVFKYFRVPLNDELDLMITKRKVCEYFERKSVKEDRPKSYQHIIIVEIYKYTD